MAKVISLDRARAAKQVAKRLFAQDANVVGIGITRVGKGFGLKVNLTSATGAPPTLPAELEDVPLVVEVVGPLQRRDPR
jgi:hypothetical protein